MRIEPEQVLKEQRVAAQGRVEDADSQKAFQDDEDKRHGQDRHGQEKNETGGINRPDEDRQAPPGQTRRPQPVDGDDEVEAGEDRREPGDDNADQRRGHIVMGGLRAVWSVERPAGVEPVGQYGIERPSGGHHEKIPARQVDARESQVLGADHQRDAEVAEHRRHDRHEKEEHHDDAVNGEEPVIGVRFHQAALGRHQVQADDGDGAAADEEHRGDGEQVEDGDALVVPGQQPGDQAVRHVEVVWARLLGGGGKLTRFGNKRAHGCGCCGLMGGVVAGGGNSSTRGGVSPRFNDLK